MAITCTNARAVSARLRGSLTIIGAAAAYYCLSFARLSLAWLFAFGESKIRMVPRDQPFCFAFGNFLVIRNGQYGQICGRFAVRRCRPKSFTNRFLPCSALLFLYKISNIVDRFTCFLRVERSVLKRVWTLYPTSVCASHQ